MDLTYSLVHYSHFELILFGFTVGVLMVYALTFMGGRT